ncbi:MAG: dihydroorotase [Bacteroidetes bacterium GWF2_41_9]|nr:MAG: dihydroorotase [Bacteroidetes bacterium GWF2_41_9]HAM11330.1 dihydroorotase [Bacteroidales bacterium]HBH82815.1 dihydroorotase [Bacteroidales bacterium]HBQ82867.1 dihydroorotase [Bacteroidales bacterium]HCU19630.1 dihydroorotase [Bacteroidales bacterium]
MSSILINNATIINEGRSFRGSLLIKDEFISAIGTIPDKDIPVNTRIINASGLLLLPGIIDDQVHFREPGLTHKGDIFSESRAAVAGGVTSYMDMPNTNPQTVTIEALEEKYKTASEKSLINYSFNIGATNDNINEVLKADPARVCGIKIFMGSSTGNMLVDNEKALRDLFKRAHMIVSAHCEDETIVRRNSESFRQKYGENVPVHLHPLIRSREACFTSSSYAVKLAEEYNTKLHIFHLSTADEMKLFSNEIPLSRKRITAEVCIHHLWFDDSDYERLGNLIKWNPAIKTKYDREALRDAVRNDHIDIIATDHAPHTLEEKSQSYFKAPSGGPLIQHSLVIMLELWHKKTFSLEKIVEKMCHNPAILFNIRQRGFIREGYIADLVLVDPEKQWTISKENILYKCGWSPFEGQTFRSQVVKTIVNGTIVYDEGKIDDDYRGQRLLFDR